MIKLFYCRGSVSLASHIAQAMRGRPAVRKVLAEMAA